MSRLLARLGGFSFRRPFAILIVWLIALVGVIGLVQVSDTQIKTSIKVDGTPAQTVLDEIQEQMPEAGGTQGSFVFYADGQPLGDSEKQTIVEAVDAVETSDYVVDRGARMTEQLTEMETTVTETAYEQAGTRLDDQLQDMKVGIESMEMTVSERHGDVTAQIESLNQGTPPQLQPWQEEMMGGGASSSQGPEAMMGMLSDLDGQLSEQGERLAALTVEIDDAFAAEGEKKFDMVADLMTEINTMVSQNPDAAQMLSESLDDEALSTLSAGTDPRDQVDQMISDQLDTVTADLAEFQEGVSPAGTSLSVDSEQVPGVTISDDETIAVYTVQLTEQLDDLPAGVSDDLIETVDTAVESSGLTASPSSSLIPMEPPIGGHEIVGVIVAAIVLIFTLGSLVTAGMPILTALLGVGVGVGGAFGLSEFYPMTSTTPVLALMLGLAVGIDYALFILHKQRTLILAGMSARDATSRAVGTAGSAVVFAGTTVVIALLGLLLLNITFVTTMALAAAATVTIAVLISITALPALLGLAGERVVNLKHRARAMVTENGHVTPSRRWSTALTKRPWAAVVGVAILLGLLAVPAMDMRLGMPTGASASIGSPERTSYDLTAKALGEGANGPLLVAVERPEGEPDMENIRTTLSELSDIDGVANAALRGTNEDRTIEMYEITPDTGPMTEETEHLVNTLREPGVIVGAEDVGVTGLTAINIDLSERLGDAVPVYLAVVAGLSLIVLTLVFRSLIIPIAATAGFLLTIGATFGITTSVFGTNTIGWVAGVDQPGTVLSFLPIMATGILYGLAMDYQLFIGTSMREAHTQGDSPRDAVINGFSHASRVVIAAAIIMVSVFGVFVLTDDMMIRQFGFTLALGILIDAFLIRMTLMPAVLSVAGRSAWWLPGWLDRILPHLDVEGSRLDQAQATPVPETV